MNMTDNNLPYRAPSGWEEEEHNGTVEQLVLDLNPIQYPEIMALSTNQITRELPMQDDLTHISYPVSRKSNVFITGSITFAELQEQLPTLTHTDMLVYFGISNLYNEGNTRFTPQMVWRMMKGNPKARVTPNQKEIVVESIDKMRQMLVDIDVTAEFIDLYKKDEVGNPIRLNENLLYLRKATVIIQGKEQDGYQLLAQPVLDRYSRELRQIGYIERNLIESTGGVEDALLNKYMAERLIGMKNNKSGLHSKRILLSKVYEKMDLDDPNRKKRSQVKTKIEGLLNSWKQKGEIKSYEFVMKNGAYHAVDLDI